MYTVRELREAIEGLGDETEVRIIVGEVMTVADLLRSFKPAFETTVLDVVALESSDYITERKLVSDSVVVLRAGRELGEADQRLVTER